MEEKNNNHSGGGNGFLAGLIIGGVVTLLFTTKRGREIVKELTEKGLDKFTELEDSLKEKKLEDSGESDYVVPVERPGQPQEVEKPKLLAKEDNKVNKTESKKSNIPTAPKPPREVKRFFRLKKN